MLTSDEGRLVYLVEKQGFSQPVAKRALEELASE
jgi:hypothetical protein